MVWTDFISNHIFGVSLFIIFLALVFRFIILPRMKMTPNELQQKAENLVDSMEVNTEDIIDESSLPMN